MNQEMVSVFYNERFGYIIASYSKFEDSGIPTVIEPVMTVGVDTSPILLGDKVLESLNVSKNAIPIVDKDAIKDFHYWYVSGIKSFGTFSKKFEHIKILKKDNIYEFICMERAPKGGYIISKNREKLNSLTNISNQRIGEIILDLLMDNVILKSDAKMLNTVNENTVSYTRLSDKFEDIGDGHTDAYQIYTYEDNEANSIIFMIDNLYKEISEESIKEQWEKWYGELIEYKYIKTEQDALKFIIYGKTQKMEIKTYLYEDGDSLMEVSTKLDLMNTSIEQQEEIREEFQKVIASIKIEAIQK